MFSSKKSSTSQTIATTNSLGFSESDGSTAIVGSGNSVLDGGAIAEAFGFAAKSGTDAYDFARSAFKDSMGIAGEIVSSSAALTANVAAKAVQDESDKIAELVKWIVGGLVVVGAAMMLRKGRA